MMKLNKKAQMEMIGLVVIVILITLGMLFLAQFALKEKPDKKVFTRKGLAYSSMSAVLKTTVECGDPVGIGERLIEACAVSKGVAGQSKLPCLRGKDSCEFVKDIIEELLKSTLGTWRKRYEFTSKLLIPNKADPELLFSVSEKGGCQFRERETSGLFPIQTDEGLVENMLYICD